ncbi:MAG TPA: hypothetical protein VIP11_05815 [Gemmatimonadaceae bacterium]
MKHLARGAVAALSVSALAMVAACGGSSTGPTEKNAMTAQEAVIVASGIMTEMSRALSSSTARLNISAGLLNVSTRPTETFNSTCANGGKISGSMTFTDNINSAGTGTFSGTMTATSQGCMVSNGSRLIAVGGQWTFDYNMSFNQFAQVGDFTWRATGSFNWEGGNCSIDYTMKLSAAGHGSITGTFCGVSLNQTI